jgi:deazaflavin-dependent oxidoreductase (nitroreductase family)
MKSTNKKNLKDRLKRYRQIRISVVGRKTGQTISVPVWFVVDADKLYLLPVRGSETQWYQNVLKNPSLKVDARGAEAAFRASPIKQPKPVNSIVEKFREKYGAGDVKKYYSKFDVAVLVGTI